MGVETLAPGLMPIEYKDCTDSLQLLLYLKHAPNTHLRLYFSSHITPLYCLEKSLSMHLFVDSPRNYSASSPLKNFYKETTLSKLILFNNEKFGIYILFLQHYFTINISVLSHHWLFTLGFHLWHKHKILTWDRYHLKDAYNPDYKIQVYYWIKSLQVQ